MKGCAVLLLAAGIVFINAILPLLDTNQQATFLLINHHDNWENVTDMRMQHHKRFLSVSEVKMKMWLHYLWHMMHKAIINTATVAGCCKGSIICLCGATFSIQHFSTSFNIIAQYMSTVHSSCLSFDPAVKERFRDYGTQTLSTPCNTLLFRGRSNASVVWYITVHTAFMLNITVHRAYTPYTDHCTQHHHKFYTGNYALLEHVCGHSHY